MADDFPLEILGLGKGFLFLIFSGLRHSLDPNLERPLIRPGEAIDLEGDWLLPICVWILILYIFFNRNTFYEQGSFSCRIDMSEKNISDDTFLLMFKYSSKLISFLFPNTVSKKFLISPC